MPLFRAKFFKDLDKVDSQNDVYGRPAHTWKWDGDKIGTYADVADYTVVLDKTYTTLADVVKFVLDETDDTLNADHAINNAGVWFNGAQKANMAAVVAQLATEAEAGTVLELFVNDDDVTVDAIVAYNYDIAEIVSVTNKVSAAAAKKDATTSIKVEYADESTAVKYDAYENTPANVLAGFDADTYTEGTMIAVVKNGSTIIDSCVVDSVSGKISSFKQNTHAVVDGTKYVMAGDVALTAVDFDEEYTLYLDPNGYVLKVAGNFGATIEDVFYITGVYTDVDSKENTVKYAETVSLTGEVADKVISDAAFTTLSGGAGFVETAAGLYTMTLNADDKYEVVAFTNSHADYDVYTDATMTDDVKADAASATIGSKVYFDAATAFTSVKTTAAGAVKEVKTAEGGMSYAGANNAKAIAITEQGERDALYVLYVGANMSSTVVTDDVVFVSAVSTEEDSAETFLTDVVYMADNAEDEMSVKTASAKAVGFYKYALNADNQYELSSVERHTGTVDEDTTGWAYLGFAKAGIHGTTVTASGMSNFEDIKFGSAAIVDLRTDATIEVSVYDREILTVSDLIDAADAGEVAAYAYIIDGEITFIAVENVIPDATIEAYPWQSQGLRVGIGVSAGAKITTSGISAGDMTVALCCGDEVLQVMTYVGSLLEDGSTNKALTGTFFFGTHDSSSWVGHENFQPEATKMPDNVKWYVNGVLLAEGEYQINPTLWAAECV